MVQRKAVRRNRTRLPVRGGGHQRCRDGLAYVRDPYPECRMHAGPEGSAARRRDMALHAGDTLMGTCLSVAAGRADRVRCRRNPDEVYRARYRVPGNGGLQGERYGR